MTRTTVTLSILAVGAVCVASPAFARNQRVVVTAQSADTPRERVSYRDLNLATREGAGMLQARVNRASLNVCVGSDFTPQEVVTQRCAKAAYWRAQPQMQAAIERAQQIALTGHSSIAAAAIVIADPRF